MNSKELERNLRQFARKVRADCPDDHGLDLIMDYWVHEVFGSLLAQATEAAEKRGERRLAEDILSRWRIGYMTSDDLSDLRDLLLDLADDATPPPTTTEPGEEAV